MAGITCCRFALLALALLVAAVAAAPKLQAYNVDVSETSVSGLSSGGFFAVQMHVAFSSIMKGAGIFAGGPYNCAQGSISKATSQCMNALSPPPVSSFISTTNTRASNGQLDPTSNLANQRVFMFSGTADTTVRQPVMDALQTYYKNYITGPQGSIVYANNIKAAHTQPTDDPINKNACTTSASPYISNCNYDGAGYALQQIYGNLTARNNGQLSGSLIQFDQSEFISSGYGMATSGWLYVPASCSQGTPCKLHIAFHGCLQNYATVGNAYINNTGYNKWADTNNMIVLYPQTVATHINPSNPNGCWDWWGYDNNPSSYDIQSGYQMAAVKKMIDRIVSGAGSVTVNPPTGLTATGSTASSVSLKWTASTSTGVTGYNVYRNDALANSSPVSGTTYTDSGLASGTSYTYYVRAVAGSSLSAPSSSISASTSGSPPPLTAPQNLQVKSTTSTSVTLSWNSVSGASGYNVFRNGTLSNSQPTTSTSYTDSGLVSGTTYSYTVSAVNAEGTGPASSAVTATTSSGFACTTTTASNYEHVQAGRAYVKLGYTYANGSNDSMGLYNIFIYTTLAETGPNFYIVGACPNEDLLLLETERIVAKIV